MLDFFKGRLEDTKRGKRRSWCGHKGTEPLVWHTHALQEKRLQPACLMSHTQPPSTACPSHCQLQFLQFHTFSSTLASVLWYPAGEGGTGRCCPSFQQPWNAETAGEYEESTLSWGKEGPKKLKREKEVTSLFEKKPENENTTSKASRRQM